MPAVKSIGGLIPLNQYAEQFNIPYSTAHAAARDGRIPGIVKLGSRYFVPRKIVDAIAAGDPLDQFMASAVS
jgi:hypothetical protein